MADVQINNLTQVALDEKMIKTVVEGVLKGERASARGEVSVAFLGPGRMRKLNKAYRKQNKTTDVLAFPEKQIAFLKYKIGQVKQAPGLGEIVICLRELKKNCKRFKTNFNDELKRVLVHGVLHLLGYAHEKDKQKAEEMREKEEKYLK